MNASTSLSVGPLETIILTLIQIQEVRFQKNTFQNVACQIAAILFRPQRVYLLFGCLMFKLKSNDVFYQRNTAFIGLDRRDYCFIWIDGSEDCHFECFRRPQRWKSR